MSGTLNTLAKEPKGVFTMGASIFQTITGRRIDIGALTASEREFLQVVQEAYATRPEWTEFASLWLFAFQKKGLPKDSLVVRVCQDLEARLGIAQGKVAPPDYRDYVADLIEERFGSRYKFCRETGIDPGHLSRVLSSQSDLSVKSLQHVLVALKASLIVESTEELSEHFSVEEASLALAEAAAG